MVHVIARVCSIVVVGGVVAAVPAVSQAPPAAAAGSCPSVVLVATPGTWETTPGADGAPVGMLAPIAQDLEAKYGPKFEAQFVGYDAQAFTGGVTYGESKQSGVAATEAAVADWSQRCPGALLLLSGYSQGAAATGDVASSIGCASSPVKPDRVLGVGLLSDPNNGTEGGKPLGAAGDGIAGPRDAGFCDLGAVTAEICAPEDKYCNTDVKDSPLLAAAGRVLGADPGSSQAREARSLAAEVDPKDLEELPANLATLTDPESDPAGVPGAAAQATRALSGLGEVQSWASDPAAKAALDTTEAGTPQGDAARFLDSAQGLDIPGALESVQTIATAANTPGSPVGNIADAASRLSTQVEPITADQGWSAVSRGLAVLKPQLVVDQAVNVVSGSVEFATNLPRLVEVMQSIPGVVAAPGDWPTKVRQVRDVFRELNTLLEPLVRMAAGVDLHMVSGLIGAASILDTTGVTAIVAAVVDLIGNVDVLRVAREVGQLQEVLWRALEGNPVELVGAAGPLLNLVSVGLDAITGKPKTSSPLVRATFGGDATLAQGAEALRSAAGSDGAAALSTLVGDGVDALSFLTSGVHQGYQDPSQFSVQGKDAVSWLTDWFSRRIAAAGV